MSGSFLADAHPEAVFCLPGTNKVLLKEEEFLGGLYKKDRRLMAGQTQTERERELVGATHLPILSIDKFKGDPFKFPQILEHD